MSFFLILKIGVLILALILSINAMMQRSSNKKNLTETVYSEEHIRELTPQEFSLLQPYLDDKTKVQPYKHQSSLVNNKVFLIVGPCIKVEKQNNEKDYYYEISGIEVFFPYAFGSHVSEINYAEVVFTSQYAFIVKLNGIDIEQAKNEYEHDQLLNNNWSSGIKGNFKKYSNDEIESLKKELDDPNDIEFFNKVLTWKCEIIGQRTETVLEHKRHNKNYGIVTSIFLILFMIFGLIYDGENNWSLVISIISLILAIVFYILPRRMELQKINQVRGTISEKNQDKKALLIGDTLETIYPKHWDTFLPETSQTTHEFDITVDDKYLMKYDYNLSLEDEYKQFGKPKFWGRNLILAIIGLILSLATYNFMDSIIEKTHFSYAHLTNKNSSTMVYRDSNYNYMLGYQDNRERKSIYLPYRYAVDKEQHEIVNAVLVESGVFSFLILLTGIQSVIFLLKILSNKLRLRKIKINLSQTNY